MPKIKAISCTNVFVCLASVLFDRNWESLARRQGCVEIFTLCGRFSMLWWLRVEMCGSEDKLNNHLQRGRGISSDTSGEICDGACDARKLRNEVAT
jgi:hypothetical protein